MSNDKRFHWNLSRTTLSCGVIISSSHDEYWKTEQEIQKMIAPGGRYAGYQSAKLTGLALHDW